MDVLALTLAPALLAATPAVVPAPASLPAAPLTAPVLLEAKRKKRAEDAGAAKPKKRGPLAPLPEGVLAGWVHAPYETGDCDVCHESNDPDDPGGMVDEINTLCLDCHEEISARIASKQFYHEAIDDDCTVCHNPHDSEGRMLLRKSIGPLCVSCHAPIRKMAGKDVRHDAMTDERSCMNCHDPHASDIEHLLQGIAVDLCLECHGQDGLRDSNDEELTNFRTFLAENSVPHAPVEAGDCTACHQPHGSANMRLLVEHYPETFYTSFDLDEYALCLGCHDKENLTEQWTTTLTGFRDGDRNLHYVHVNREDRGRTCRACHEVHASNQAHHIRASVPYGSRGWMLKLHYQKTENGGSCSKTCHPTRAYDRVTAVNVENGG